MNLTNKKKKIKFLNVSLTPIEKNVTLKSKFITKEKHMYNYKKKYKNLSITIHSPSHATFLSYTRIFKLQINFHCQKHLF